MTWVSLRPARPDCACAIVCIETIVLTLTPLLLSAPRPALLPAGRSTLLPQEIHEDDDYYTDYYTGDDDWMSDEEWY